MLTVPKVHTTAKLWKIIKYIWQNFSKKLIKSLVPTCLKSIFGWFRVPKNRFRMSDPSLHPHSHFHYTTLLNYFSIMLLWIRNFWINTYTYLASHIYLDVEYFKILKKNPNMNSITKLCAYIWFSKLIDDRAT